MKKFIGMLIIVGLCGSASAAVVTTATIMGGRGLGGSTDLFQNATVTASSPTNTQFLFFDVRDIFTEGSPVMQDDVVFADTNGTVHHVEFNTANALSLRRVKVVLANDNEAGEFSQQRSLINFKFYARDTAGAFTVTELVADIDVEENYTAAYGSSTINAEVTFPSAISSQYFRLEFEQPVRPWEYAPRVLEVDAFDSLEDGEVLANGGFEDSAPITVTIQNPPVVDTSIAGWRVFNTEANPMTMEVVSNAAVAAEGTNYLQVTSTYSGVAGQDGGIDRLDVTAPQSLVAGLEYVVSFDLQHVSGTNGIFAQLSSFAVGSGATIDTFFDLHVTPDTGVWTHYSYTIYPTAGGVFNAGFRPKIGVLAYDQVFLLDNLVLELAPYNSNVVTSATFTGTAAGENEGVNGDAFDGATITAYSPLHPVSTTPAEWFSAPNATQLLFDDNTETKFIEFNTAGAVALTNLVVGLGGDIQPGAEGRSINRIKLYASTTPSVWDASTLAVSVPVNADYDGTYGTQFVVVSIDLASVPGQYFRIEFSQHLHGARIAEIDGFGTPYVEPLDPPSIVSWSILPNDLMEIVVNTPSSANRYFPQANSALVSGSWGSVPHSDNGANSFLVTNLDYSAIDASGTNKVIYVETTDAQKFFNIGGN